MVDCILHGHVVADTWSKMLISDTWLNKFAKEPIVEQWLDFERNVLSLNCYGH